MIKVSLETYRPITPVDTDTDDAIEFVMRCHFNKLPTDKGYSLLNTLSQEDFKRENRNSVLIGAASLLIYDQKSPDWTDANVGQRLIYDDPNNPHSAYRYIRSTEVWTTHSCHAKVQSRHSPAKAFASIYMGYRECDKEFWRFITSPESPWRILFKDGPWKTFGTDDIIYGFCVPNHLMNEKELWPVVYNFLVASRIPAEYPRETLTWYKLVKEYSVAPARAMLIARCFNFQERGNFLPAPYRLDGAHHPLKDTYSSDDLTFDVRAFEEGRPYLHGVNACHSTMIWRSRVRQKPLSFKGAMNETKTKFSTVRDYNVRALVDSINQQI